jgi:hypothetical protein
MKSKQLQTLGTVSFILIFVWLVGFGILAWNGAFGDPNKPANPLFFLLWWAPAGLFIWGSAVLNKHAKIKADAEALHKKNAPAEPLTPLDTSGEMPESLEKAYKGLLGARFRYEVLPIVGLTILGFGVSIIFAIFAKSTSNEVLRPVAAGMASSSPMAGGIFSGVHSITILYQVLLAVGCAIASLVGAVLCISRTVQLMKPIQSGKTPEDTCKLFYSALLTPGATVRNYPKAFVCLMDAAKKRCGGYKGFRDHWSEVIRLSNLASPASRIPSPFSISKAIGASDSESRTTRSISFSHFLCQAELMRVRDRWYLTSGRWTGQPR